MAGPHKRRVTQALGLWAGRTVTELVRNALVEKVHLMGIHKLAMKEWPLAEDPDIQIEIWGRSYSDEMLMNAEAGLAFAPNLGPDLCTALPVPGYTGRKPEFTPEGIPIVWIPDSGAAVLIQTDGGATILRQW